MKMTIKTEHALGTTFEIWPDGREIKLPVQGALHGDKAAQRQSGAHKGRCLVLRERPKSHGELDL